MSYHIKIQGYIDSYDWGWEGEKVYTATKIEEQLELAKGRDLLIDIDSVGGCVHTGINIYSKIRRYAKLHDASVTTRTDGFVASIATIIFLSGDNRVVNEFMQPFVHEPSMWIMSENVDEIKKEAESLDTVRQMLAEFYSKHTTLSTEEALVLMKEDSWMDADFCLSVGFATEIEELSNSDYKLVASLKSKLNQKPNNKKMSKKEEKLSWVGRLLNMRTNHSVKAELELADVAGNAVMFPELDSEDTPSQGDKVTVDGDANHTGTVETEEYILSVEDGVLTEVIVIAEIDKDEVIDELLETIEKLEEEVVTAKAESTRLTGVMNAMKSGGKPDTDKKQKQDKPLEKSSGVSASIAKIVERNKNKK